MFRNLTSILMQNRKFRRRKSLSYFEELVSGFLIIIGIAIVILLVF